MAIKGLTKTIYQRYYMRKRRNGTPMPTSYCRACGYDLIMELHHKDGDHNNVSPENIIPLCPNCHALISRGKVTWDELMTYGNQHTKMSRIIRKKKIRRVRV